MNKNFRVSTTSFLCALTVTAAAVLSGCGGDSASTDTAPPDGPPPAVERSIAPATIDPRATKAPDPHFTINPSPSVTAKNKLFVFLPGTQGVPSMFELIVQQASASGYHAIGLNYVNEVPVGVLCAGSSDSRCFWNVRREIILGQDLTNLVDVDPPNSIVSRLSNAIAYLNTNFPSEGWGQYLKSDGTTDWTKVVVGGHSQGGGHAGVMTKLFSMSRACYFSSPPDFDNGPAEWMTEQQNVGPTPQFGFAGLSDPSVQYDELSANFQALGLGTSGAAVSVDTNTPPYNGSHILTTNAAPDPTATDAGGTPLHGLTVRDVYTPKTSSGSPVFAPAWGYLCFQ